MIDVRFVPIEKWPGKPTEDREKSPFRASYSDTLDLLDRELFHVDARNVTIQAYFEWQSIRNDGWPYSGARPSQPGVIVSFEKKSQWDAMRRAWNWDEISFPCDRFKAWEDNLRAIALALEALRKVDRYGVTQGSEQYKGWTRLAAPEAPKPMTRDEAVRFIRHHAGIANGDLQDAYRAAAMKLHPDRGGNHELFVRLQQAMEIAR